jgi:hypothetical protein
MNKMNFKTITISFITISLLTGCMGSKTARKKMPGYESGATGENGRKKMLTKLDPYNFEPCYSSDNEATNINEGINMAPSNIEIFVNGSIQSCVGFYLPNASFDTQVFQLVESYKPFATPLLAQWWQQNKKGVVVDLRSENKTTGTRVDYNITGAGFSFPVVLIWDHVSAVRVNDMITMAQEMPGILINQTGEEFNY